MTHARTILKCLPLLASALGRRYGVTVEVGGTEAFTDGSVIRLPALPLEADERFLGLVRGYIDHEAAHIRHSDFDLIKTEQPSPLLHHIWNIFEDWRVERCMTRIFPGCRHNFQWLIREVFGNDAPNDGEPFLTWLVLVVRSWSLPELQVQVNDAQDRLDVAYPGIRQNVEPILADVQRYCPDTSAALAYAKRVEKALKTACRIDTRQGQKSPSEASETPIKQGPNSDNIRKLLEASESDLPSDMGKIVGGMLKVETSQKAGHDVAIESPKNILPLSPADLETCRMATSGLRNRLDALLQSTRQRRSRIGRRGKLSPRLLHRTVVNDPRLFLSREAKPAINTAVHILLDCSGSMRKRIGLASKACYALGLALERSGINVAITAFPGEVRSRPTVTPIVCHGDRITSTIQPQARGRTPLGEALWWSLSQMLWVREPRKILLIITDGIPDNPDLAQKAIRTATGMGVECLALGIQTITGDMLRPARTADIEQISDLPAAMFAMLQSVMLRQAL